jgi:hypothetical protein
MSMYWLIIVKDYYSKFQRVGDPFVLSIYAMQGLLDLLGYAPEFKKKKEDMR